MKKFFNSAQGYAVFPTVGKGGIGIGAARGKGLVYERGRRVGEVTLTQVTMAHRLGGRPYSEVVFLENKETMESFKGDDFALSAQVSATAAASGASSNAKYKLGRCRVHAGQGRPNGRSQRRRTEVRASSRSASKPAAVIRLRIRGPTPGPLTPDP